MTTVDLNIDGSGIIVRGFPIDELARQLMPPRRIFRLGRRGGRWDSKRDSVLLETALGRRLPHHMLIDAHALLQRLGRTVRVATQLPEPLIWRLLMSRYEIVPSRELLGLVVARLYEWDGTRRLVVAASRREIDWLTRAVKARYRDAYGDSAGDVERMFRDGQRIAVVSTSLFGCTNDYDWDYVLFFRARALLHEDAQARARQLLQPPDHCLPPMVMACVDDRPLTTPRDRTRVEMYVGRADAWAWLYQPQAVILHAHGLGISDGTSDLRHYRRDQIWRNDCRNELIARTARKLIDQAQRQQQLKLWGTPKPQWYEAVTLLVESYQHARLLHRLLPDWYLPRREEISPGRRLHRHIMTPLGLRDAQARTNILIRATGTPAPITEIEYLCCQGMLDSHMLVVDFADGDDPRSAGYVAQRCADYVRRGWHPRHIYDVPR